MGGDAMKFNVLHVKLIKNIQKKCGGGGGGKAVLRPSPSFDDMIHAWEKVIYVKINLKFTEFFMLWYPKGTCRSNG